MSLNIPRLHKIATVKKDSSTVKTFGFNSEEIAKECKPGQFVMVWSPGIDEIPISIAQASSDGLLELAIADIGDCSHSLHQKHVGDLIGLRGPYGTSFCFSSNTCTSASANANVHGERVCIIAGGYGAAPLRFAATRAKEVGKDVLVLEGACSSTELL